MSNSVTTQTSSKTEFNLPAVSRVPRQEPKYRSTTRSNFIQKYSTSVYPENVHVESDNKKQGEKPVSTVKESINSKSRKWCRYFTPKQAIIGGIVLAVLIIAGATLTPVLLHILQKTDVTSSIVNEIASVCSKTTCIPYVTSLFRSSFTRLYQFDGNTYDFTQTAVGQVHSISTLPTFYDGAIAGQAIYILPSLKHYIVIPHIDFSSKSFTLEMWIAPYWAGGSPDFGIFGQCGFNGTGIDQCLSLSIRNNRLRLSFDSMGGSNLLTSMSLITASYVYVHITIVYDATLFEQRIYLNGKLDAKSVGKIEPFHSGPEFRVQTTLMMSSSIGYESSYFSGLLDHFVLFVGEARTSCQILNDATLTAYFPFDRSSPFVAQGMYWYSGVTSGTTVIENGRFNQALYFNTSSSYFQAKAWTTTRGTNQAFSVSMWIKPTRDSLINGATLVHISTDVFGVTSPCYDLLGLTAGGSLVAQISPGVSTVIALQGPVIVEDAWIHVALIYGQGYGMHLWINGSLFNITTVGVGVYAFIPSYYVTLGNTNPGTGSPPVGCAPNALPIVTLPYSGAIDEFRLYQRELDRDEICVLSGA